MTTTQPQAGPRQRSLSTYEGWNDFAERSARTRPDTLSREQLAAISTQERVGYDLARRQWHANILLRTRQVQEIELQLGDILDSNLQDADRVKSAAAIDAPPALGKSTVVNNFGRVFHQQRIAEAGEWLDQDRDVRHLPVCHVTLTGRPTIKGLHMMILGFYAHPATAGILHRSMAGRDLARAAAECIERHDTRLVIVDDLHFLRMNTRDGVEVANQLKWLSNEYNATFLFAGVALRKRGLVGEGQTGEGAAMAQTFRRWTVLTLEPFTLTHKRGRDEWDRLLFGIEQALVLTDGRDGMLVDLSRYLFARTTGNIGSLMDLIRRGASRAIRTGNCSMTFASTRAPRRNVVNWRRSWNGSFETRQQDAAERIRTARRQPHDRQCRDAF